MSHSISTEKHNKPPKGLNHQQVEESRKQFGYNEINLKKEFTALKIFISQFRSTIVLVLAIAATISLSIGKTVDGLAVFAIIIINAIIGFLQEYKAENAIKALKKLVIPNTVVIRNGEKIQIPIRELVPGDIVILEEGDKVPADIKLLEAFSLKVDEAVLTGESVPSEKFVSPEKEGLLFSGTLITTGRAEGQVIYTGLNTEFGKIINLVAKQEQGKSPLANQLDDLGKKLGLLIFCLITILFVLGELRGIPLVEMLMTSVALGVSAIPEGMPIIVTLTLAMGVQILARKKAIVKKMSSIEALGATTVICSDKTGTLTLNEMTVSIINTNFTDHKILGQGYEFKEKFIPLSEEEKKLIQIGDICNNAYLGKNILGDPTEIALKVLAKKAHLKTEFTEIDENVFTSERKMMSSLIEIEGKQELMAKGAFEEILKKCDRILLNGKIENLTTAHKKQITEIAENYSKNALRVLGMAYKEAKDKIEEISMVFVGLVGMIDPPRASVKKSIEIAQAAGIKIKIITGDNPITAKAIGELIGLRINNIMTGDDIDGLDDEKLLDALENTEIFARTKPQHKYRLVDLLKKKGEIVTVTGDGVNDAPALKHADVGVAMGIKGTEATKEVADIVLKDDNFSTIVNTIEEGRRIYQNILAFIKYMLSANYGAIFTVGILTLLGMPLPLLPLQILWINLATDALPALALGKSKADPGIMQEKPHPKNENMFKKFALFIFTACAIQIVGNLAMYYYGLEVDLKNNIDTTNLDQASYARTLVFTEMIIFELYFAFVCKSEKGITLKSVISNKSLLYSVLASLLLQIGMIYLPFMQQIFKTTPLSLTDWGIMIIIASSAFLVPGAAKMVRKVLVRNQN